MSRSETTLLNKVLPKAQAHGEAIAYGWFTNPTRPTPPKDSQP